MTTYVNGSRADLLAGLNHMIGLVEDLKDVYEFDMNMYSWCRYRDWETDRKSTRLNSSHSAKSRMPSSA